MQRTIAAIAFLCVLVLSISPSEARPHGARQAVQHAAVVACDNDGRCTPRAVETPQGRRGAGVAVADQSVSARPAACPRRWCGCGASLYLFGRVVPRLNLAANWLAFPRAAPAPDMAAARRGHVFVLKQHIEGSTWLVYDANSGGGKARVHARSISGFTIVNPRAA